MNKTEIPKELLEGRDSTECNLIFSLYKDPVLLTSYQNLSVDDFVTSDGKFYFSLLVNMDKAHYQTIDSTSIYEYLSDKEKIRDEFEKRGGYETVKEITGLLTIDNIDTYYDNLAKSNILIGLNDRGFNVMNNLEKFKEMTAEQVYDFFEYQLNDVVVNKVEKVHVCDLKEDNDKEIDEWDKGKAVGFKILSGMLNRALLGIHKGKLLLHGAKIGGGKTTSSLIQYAIPALEEGENCLVLSNESDEHEFRQMLVGYELFNDYEIKKPKGLNRQKILAGSYTPEQKEALKQAAKSLKSKKGNIKFGELEDYNLGTIKKMILKYSKLGYSLIIVDTLKPISDSSSETTSSWGEFSDMSRELSLLAKKTETAIVCTFQLASDSMNRKYLDLMSVGKSRAITEPAHAVVEFRHIGKDEYENIHPYVYEKTPEGAKIKVTHDLDPDKHYIIVFYPKNRSGGIEPQIVMEFDQNFLRMKDIGYYDQPFDNFQRRG